ncbi:hypothetical protein Pcinc_042666 [Petrolisthes cinctipes]|uniref:Uncharacterized protein n=1 Tax=Petrolisthes cinctipes TaxID=88211 RepID=A0AAE1BHA9_PETCI|nr:hypothetical protein Pcinc_042666 [Petrolisthes cinctipes]
MLHVAHAAVHDYHQIQVRTIDTDIVLLTKARALPVFHAMTGCDTVSAFMGHGKKSARATWNSFPQLTDSLLTLTTTPVNIQNDIMHCIKRFVVLLYDCTSPYMDVNEARKKLFAKRNSVHAAHPTNL